mmetsp:Transcript_2212/g.2301  ORF Transcript_2212/g.2301 Transcript_2212/m.2301 type:complete len:108 (-) Transcript_2212:87-410(-)
MSGLANGLIRTVAKQYQAIVAARLAPYGLKYNDLLVETEDVKGALTRIDPDILLERERRIKRAFDISAKKKFLAPEFQSADTFDFYLKKDVEKVQLEREEREIINSF